MSLKDRSFKSVVVHRGQAHRDEFVACAVALALFPSLYAIFRRDPTPEEIEDPAVLVLDVGGEHSPEKGNFDHHQLPRESAPACALSLFVEALGLKERFELMAWYAATAIMDSKGPMSLAKHLGLASPDAIFRNMSPIEGSLLSLFEAEREIVRPETGEIPVFWTVLRDLGRSMVGHANELWGQLEWLSANARMIDIHGVPAMVVESTNTTGTQQFRDTRCPGVGICVSWDDRGEGWSLYRFNDHPAVDFAPLGGDPRVLFAHAGGFIAKTRERIPIADVLTLAAQGVALAEKREAANLNEALAARNP